MSPFFDDLEAQLHAAARAQAGAGRPRRRWMRSGVRGSPVIAAAAVTVAVVVVALTLHGHGPSHPTQSAAHRKNPLPSVSATPTLIQIAPLSPKQQRELPYVNAAQAKALKTRACRSLHPAEPSTSNGAPSHALLSTIGVLRRARTPQDMPIVRGKSLQFAIGDVQGTYVRYIRLARVNAGVSYYVVPAQRLEVLPLADPACQAEQVAELRAELPHIPTALRSGALTLQAQRFGAINHVPPARPQEAVCLFAARGLSLSGSCATAADLERKGIVVPYGTTLSGVVPDGVASVTLHYRAIRGFPGMTVTSDVVANMFVAAARRAPNGAYPATIVWRAASGTVIKTVSTATP